LFIEGVVRDVRGFGIGGDGVRRDFRGFGIGGDGDGVRRDFRGFGIGIDDDGSSSSDEDEEEYSSSVDEDASTNNGFVGFGSRYLLCNSSCRSNSFFVTQVVAQILFFVTQVVVPVRVVYCFCYDDCYRLTRLNVWTFYILIGYFIQLEKKK
jgi:hypothetical protein